MELFLVRKLTAKIKLILKYRKKKFSHTYTLNNDDVIHYGTYFKVVNLPSANDK